MSAKRPRAQTNGISQTTKRPRHSSVHSSDVSSSGEGPAASDNGISDDEANEHDYEHMVWATQQVQKDFCATENTENVATDSGIIEEIQCINFMCHEHLTVTLGPLINFIIGHNGSGKSAVLTALTICLGGKATATNRAQNLKSLIKEGKEHSVVTVRLKNRGPLAYRPAQYGSSIIVERHFNRTGSSGFKLKDRNGRIVSTKKSELEDILDAFSMQIDNPMNVLTQDMARQFLNSSTPKDKYKFFLQGTQLETLSRDYQQIDQSLELMNARANVKEEDLKELRKQMEDLVKRARRAESLEKMRAKETVLAHQAAWARVQYDEGQLADAERELERVDQLIATRQQVADDVSNSYDRANQALQVAQETVLDILNFMEPVKLQAQEAEGLFRETKDKLITLKADERSISESVKMKEKTVQKHEADIEQLRRRQAEADDGIYAEKVHELEEAKRQHERADEVFTSHIANLPTLLSQVQTTQKEVSAANQKVHKAREDEKRIRNTIRNLKEGQRKWVDAYYEPEKLDQLLQAIESDRRFREKPVGPLGRHVKLLKPEWAYILEKQFGAVLNGFVVTSKADQSLLSELQRRFKWHSAVFIGNRAHINTSANEPNPELLTWQKALKIDNDLVRNVFIINQGIEQTVLFENRNEGTNFMRSRGVATRNVKMCFTFAEGDKRKGRVINFTSNGGINDSPIGQFQGHLRMQADKDDQIRQEQIHLERARRAVGDVEKAFQEVQDQLAARKGEHANHERQKKILQVGVQKAQDKVDRLEEELSEATPDAGAIENLEEDLKTAKEELRHAEGVYEDMVVQRDKLNRDAQTRKKNMEDVQREVSDVEFKHGKAQATVKRLQGQREDELMKKNAAIKAVASAEGNRGLWVKAREEAQTEVTQSTIDAQSVCPHRVNITDGKTSEELIGLLNRLRATRKETEKELGGSQDELLREANEAKLTHKNAQQEHDDITSLRNHLMNTLKIRHDRWKQFRSGISVRARVTFNYLLSERKFRGILSIDHARNLLDIHVQPDITERSGDGRQTKTLSGGEKSYSTVCLLLALWDAMGSPIRCLDEFDVFMDSVNRDRSMRMIIQAARRSVGRQFIFITPQSMNSVKQTSDVKIIKMSDPERGQTTLIMDGT